MIKTTSLAVLDADQRVATEILRWVRHRGTEATLSYLHKFLVAVAVVTLPALALCEGIAAVAGH